MVQPELEKLAVILKGDREKNVVGLITEIDLLKQRNSFEDRLANVAVGIGSALLVFLLTNGCTRQTPGSDPTPTPQKCVCPTPTAAPTPIAKATASPG